MAKFRCNRVEDEHFSDGKKFDIRFVDWVYETNDHDEIAFLKKQESVTELKPDPPAKATPPKGDEKPEKPETKKTGE